MVKHTDDRFKLTKKEGIFEKIEKSGQHFEDLMSLLVLVNT